ncbi:MAG: class I adenylate-forming enzyme family protein [Pseudomonadota bacterium]
MPTADDMLHGDFATLADLIAAHARERGEKVALIHGEERMTYAALDAAMDRFAAALQRDGVAQGDAVAIVGPPSIAYAMAFLGSLRAGCVPTPLATSSTPEQVAAMVADCGAPMLFDEARLADLDAWLAPAGAKPQAVTVSPSDPFNIIYSSGTTGVPKGIVQSHAMRWAHISRNEAMGFGDAVTMIATPLYSNTTLVSVLPTLGWGGTCVLLGKFDAAAFVSEAARHRATHAMLVPVQYARIMALPDFDAYDLSAFRLKTCTSAPFSAALKADVLARWPGLLVEYYGMTEGGGTCILIANAHPDKLHTVGKPAEGCEIRLIDDDGNEVPVGEMGEVVGRSGAMMTGYHGRQAATSEAEWFDADGNRYIRHGDVGRFDEDGFLTLLDRKKDVIISGGFNIYPTDIEGVLNAHPCVADGTVVGVPSEVWGETPMGFYVPVRDADLDPGAILDWVNARVGRTQRLAGLHIVEELPRSAIGKVLKRALRDRWAAAQVVSA